MPQGPQINNSAYLPAGWCYKKQSSNMRYFNIGNTRSRQVKKKLTFCACSNASWDWTDVCRCAAALEKRRICTSLPSLGKRLNKRRRRVFQLDDFGCCRRWSIPCLKIAFSTRLVSWGIFPSLKAPSGRTICWVIYLWSLGHIGVSHDRGR